MLPLLAKLNYNIVLKYRMVKWFLCRFSDRKIHISKDCSFVNSRDKKPCKETYFLLCLGLLIDCWYTVKNWNYQYILQFLSWDDVDLFEDYLTEL